MKRLRRNDAIKNAHQTDQVKQGIFNFSLRGKRSFPYLQDHGGPVISDVSNCPILILFATPLTRHSHISQRNIVTSCAAVGIG